VPQPSSTTSRPSTSPSVPSESSRTSKTPHVISSAAQFTLARASVYSAFACVQSSRLRRASSEICIEPMVCGGITHSGRGGGISCRLNAAAEANAEPVERPPRRLVAGRAEDRVLERPAPGHPDVYVMNADGSGLTMI
jgi:hypothetical protein